MNARDEEVAHTQVLGVQRIDNALMPELFVVK